MGSGTARKQHLYLTTPPLASYLIFVLCRNVAAVLDSLVHMIQEEESVRETAVPAFGAAARYFIFTLNVFRMKLCE